MTSDADRPGRTLSSRRSDRHNRISRYVLEHGSATVDTLASEARVSRMTIHRDLDELEQQGVLRKVRGGATAERSSVFESEVTYRSRQRLREKEAICRYAITLIEPGQSVLLDESTTMIPLARQLPTITPLTVVTNFLPLMQQLADRRGVHLIGLGGDYFAHYGAFHGAICHRAVASLRADVLFMSAAAVDGGKLWGPEQHVVTTKRAFIESAQRRVLLVDSSKLGKTALHLLGSVTEFDEVVIDDGCAPDAERGLRDLGVSVTVVAVDEGP